MFDLQRSMCALVNNGRRSGLTRGLPDEIAWVDLVTDVEILPNFISPLCQPFSGHELAGELAGENSAW